MKLKINNNKEFQKLEIKKEKNNFPKFSDILSISSNPEDLFTILYPIGHGGFGNVYKAIHNTTNTIVAIKIIDFIKNIKNNSQNEINKQQNISFNYYSVQQETSLMKLGNQSKYIVNYYGSYFSRKSNTLWLILEYCSSGSVIDLMLAMNRTFTEIEISTIMENVLQGLIIIHSMNLIHRDIKGANILLSEDGYAKLGDFGVGIRLTGDVYFRNSKKGSPYWMSPQVVNKINYDMKTDIWSLGITCAELCNGEPPFSNLSPKNIMEKTAMNPPCVDDIINKNEHTSEFYDFVKKCLEIDPRKRPSAKDLINHKYIRKYSKGNRYLKELISKHLEDIEKYRKIMNEINKKKMKENNDNRINEINKDIKTNEKIGLLSNIISEQSGMNSEKDDLLKTDSLQSHYNESHFTSHFYNEGKLNEVQLKEQLLINNKIILSSSNLENYAINSTKDSQKHLKNIKNDTDKFIYINYNSNNIKSDSSSENNRLNFTTFYFMDNENNTSNNDSEKKYAIHQQCASFDKNYLFIDNENYKSIEKNLFNMNNKNRKDEIKNKSTENNKSFNRPIQRKQKKNALFDNSKFNKSTDNIFLKKNKSKYSLENTKNILVNNRKDNNFIYIKPKINKISKKDSTLQLKNKNNIKNIKTETINNNKLIKNNKTGCFSNRKKEIDKIFFENNDEDINVNKTSLFRTNSNLALFENNENTRLFGNTNYCFYRNNKKLNLNGNEINNYHKERNNINNKYREIKENNADKNKCLINNSKKMNNIHQKYFEN